MHKASTNGAWRNNVPHGLALACWRFCARSRSCCTSTGSASARPRSRLSEDLGLTEDPMGYALAAFTLAYGLFEVPTGRWGDRYGSRGVLARIVIWWSVFTAPDRRRHRPVEC